MDILGIREKLNLGHTIGHAIEGAGNGSITHGEAVSIGIVACVKLSCAMKLLSKPIATKIISLIKILGLPTNVSGININKIVELLIMDKKAGKFVLIEDIGKLKAGVFADKELVIKILKEIIL